MTGARLRVGACLSLSGRYAQFGRQAAAALDIWREIDGRSALLIEDDASDPSRIESLVADLASRCDVLLGPYSTQLVRRAGRAAVESDRLLWNHGGSGDDVEAAHPGHVISVLTPTSRYAEPFLRLVARSSVDGTLWVRHGAGRFGRQVAHGAGEMARRLGIDAVVVGPGDELKPHSPWCLFSAGTFEDDVDVVRSALGRDDPPRMVCSVAAGVRSFADALGQDPVGMFGVGQWFPGSAKPPPRLGPDERTFLMAYSRATGTTPDYPAAQAFATAAIAVHCTRQAGATTRDVVWSTATRLSTSTLFGDFGVDPANGTQRDHDTVLARWTDHGLSPA
jgi:ABC-type branched-subunit amino acid transport system substrate-binding protein